ncbi:amino acid transporter AVT3B-like isoform X2 [Pomacea canaliculata]|nr:amino acid transporter AVT3B-like isoform X2 [Pomacea canaliculata]
MLQIVDCKYKILGKRIQGISKAMTREAKEEDYDSLIAPEMSSRDFLKEEGNLMISIKEPRIQYNDLSYGDIGYHALGHAGKILVDLAIVLTQTGFCCAYLIFIAENLSDYISSIKLWGWLCFLLPPLFLLTLFRHLSTLASSSLLAQISNLMAFGVVFWFDLEHLSQVNIHPTEVSIRGFPFFLAISIYCFEGAGMILSLEASLAEDVQHKFKKFFILAMVVITSLYISFGICGYLSFGQDTNEVITLNLPKGQSFHFSMVVKICLCLGIFFTYPVMLFPVIKIIENYFLPDANQKPCKGNILRGCLVMLTGFVVLAVPNFANLMALVGASCCTLLAFILPGVFHLCIYKSSITRSQQIIDWLLILFGICGTIAGTVDAFKRLSSFQTGFNVQNVTMKIVSTENITQVTGVHSAHMAITPSSVNMRFKPSTPPTANYVTKSSVWTSSKLQTFLEAKSANLTDKQKMMYATPSKSALL